MSKNINPTKAVFSDQADSVSLEVVIISDNLSTHCDLYWNMKDASGIDRLNGNMSITGTDYDTWGGDNDYPYAYVATKLGLTLLPDS